MDLLAILLPKAGCTFLTHYEHACRAFRCNRHDPASIIPANERGRYFMFGFVRNPWAWYVSRYVYFRDRNTIERGISRKCDAGLSGAQFGERFSFEQHMRWGASCPRFWLADRYMEMFFEQGKCLLRYVGMLETIAADMDRIFAMAKTSVHVTYQDFFDSHGNDNNLLNRTPHSPYQEFYTPELIQMVRAKDAEIIQKFNYRFD